MMRDEFEKLANLKISYEDYTNIIEPMYTATNMAKLDFVKFILPSARVLAKQYAAEMDENRRNNQKRVFVSNGHRTPNGCYFYGRWGALVDIKINTKSGKTTYVIRNLTLKEQRELGWDSYLGYHIDIDADANIKWVS